VIAPIKETAVLAVIQTSIADFNNRSFLTTLMVKTAKPIRYPIPANLSTLVLGTIEKAAETAIARRKAARYL
jgi:hypothetical protein